MRPAWLRHMGGISFSILKEIPSEDTMKQKTWKEFRIKNKESIENAHKAFCKQINLSKLQACPGCKFQPSGSQNKTKMISRHMKKLSCKLSSFEMARFDMEEPEVNIK